MEGGKYGGVVRKCEAGGRQNPTKRKEYNENQSWKRKRAGVAGKCSSCSQCGTLLSPSPAMCRFDSIYSLWLFILDM